MKNKPLYVVTFKEDNSLAWSGKSWKEARAWLLAYKSRKNDPDCKSLVKITTIK